MPKAPRSFIYNDEGPPQAVDKLRFAVVDRERNSILSAVWTAAPSSNPKKPDFYVTATGFQGAAKFSFHRNILNHSVLSEAHDKLIESGVVEAGSRHWQQLPIAALPWHGLTVRLASEALAKKGRSPDEFDGTIVALPPPRGGLILEVGFILAEGKGLNVNGAQFCVGQLTSGGRALVVVGRYAEHDTEKFNKEIAELLARTRLPDRAAARANKDGDYAMHLFGIDGGALVVTEIHNLRYTPPPEG